MPPFKKARILVIGDAMLDSYVHGTVERMCPEALVPVLRRTGGEGRIGGAGLAAVSLSALGCEPVFVSVIGDDAEGRQLSAMLGKEKIQAHLATEKGRPTTVKTRFMKILNRAAVGETGGDVRFPAENASDIEPRLDAEASWINHPAEMLLRVDAEETAPIAAATEDAVIKAVKGRLASCDIVVISDYLKGLLTQKVVQSVMNEAAKAGKKVIVDSKKGLSRYKGAYLAIPNAHEIALEFGQPYSNDDVIIVPLAKKLAQRLGESVIVKRSEKGATLVEKGVFSVQRHLNRQRSALRWTALTVPSKAQKIQSVVGAGDIFVSIIAASVCSGIPLKKAVEMANRGCAIAISRSRPSISAADF